MLTHHLQDPNCDATQLFKSGAIPFGKYSKYDPNDGSFSSERPRSNMEKIEKEISHLLKRNNGQLFKVEYERNGYSKDDQKSAGYYTDEEFVNRAENVERPVFRIKFKPRIGCQVHHEVHSK
jgi:hypothetical protein